MLLFLLYTIDFFDLQIILSFSSEIFKLYKLIRLNISFSEEEWNKLHIYKDFVGLITRLVLTSSKSLVLFEHKVEESEIFPFDIISIIW